MTTVFVAGEGASEIGRWSEPPEYRASSRRSDGVLAALFRKKGRVGEVTHGLLWKQITKYKAGGHATADQRALRALALKAEESGADVLLWCRDTDHDDSRERELKHEHARLKLELADRLEVIGGPAVPSIEAWIVAIAALHGKPESLSTVRLKELTAQHQLDSESRMVELIREREVDGSRAPSLENWLSQL